MLIKKEKENSEYFSESFPSLCSGDILEQQVSYSCLHFEDKAWREHVISLSPGRMFQSHNFKPGPEIPHPMTFPAHLLSTGSCHGWFILCCGQFLPHPSWALSHVVGWMARGLMDGISFGHIWCFFNLPCLLVFYPCSQCSQVRIAVPYGAAVAPGQARYTAEQATYQSKAGGWADMGSIGRLFLLLHYLSLLLWGTL